MRNAQWKLTDATEGRRKETNTRYVLFTVIWRVTYCEGPFRRRKREPLHGLLLAARERKGKDMFYLTTHSTHFIYGYMESDIWLRTILINSKGSFKCTIPHTG